MILGLIHSHSSGDLQIAEVASRFKDVEEFTSLVTSIGFRLISKVTVMNGINDLLL